MDTIVLSAENLSIGYPDKKEDKIIGENINITLKKGQLTALIGANGIGKSTLLRTLMGIQKPLKGKLTLKGKNIQEYTPASLAQNLSIVLTETLPPSNLSVYELVALGRQPYTNWLGKLSDEDIDQVERALQLTEIEHLSLKKHYEISDGQLQKVLITRALAQNTSLILLDEPTTHLDLLHKVSLLKLLKKLSVEENKSILYSTHDLDMALQLSDEIIVMTENRIIQGTPEELIENSIFNSIFKDNAITFDNVKKSFIIK